MTRPTLSICVPTWNRAHTLGPLLEALDLQLRGRRADVEVVVSDNASTDGTRRVVRRAPVPVRYRRALWNRGFDRNLRRCVALARGSYIWIVGSDDVPAPGAVSRILDTIQQCPGALIVGDVETFDGRTVTLQPTLRAPDFVGFSFHEPGDVAEYLTYATTVRAALAFLSNVVFPKGGWSTEDAPEWQDTSYTHLYQHWTTLLDGTPLVYRNRTFVRAAIGNVNDRDEDTAARVLHAVQNIRGAAALFGDARDRLAWRHLWRLEYPAPRLASLRARCTSLPAWPFIEGQLYETLDLELP